MVYLDWTEARAKAALWAVRNARGPVAASPGSHENFPGIASPLEVTGSAGLTFLAALKRDILSLGRYSPALPTFLKTRAQVDIVDVESPFMHDIFPDTVHAEKPLVGLTYNLDLANAISNHKLVRFFTTVVPQRIASCKETIKSTLLIAGVATLTVVGLTLLYEQLNGYLPGRQSVEADHTLAAVRTIPTRRTRVTTPRMLWGLAHALRACSLAWWRRTAGKWVLAKTGTRCVEAFQTHEHIHETLMADVDLRNAWRMRMLGEFDVLRLRRIAEFDKPLEERELMNHTLFQTFGGQFDPWFDATFEAELWDVVQSIGTYGATSADDLSRRMIRWCNTVYDRHPGVRSATIAAMHRYMADYPPPTRGDLNY